MDLLRNPARSDQTVLVETDQISPSCFYQSFFHQVVVFWIAVLNQRTLQGFSWGLVGT